MNRYDYIVEIMCTNPLKTVDDIDGVIEKLDETGADSVVSVVRIWDNHPSRVKYIEGDRLKVRLNTAYNALKCTNKFLRVSYL